MFDALKVSNFVIFITTNFAVHDIYDTEKDILSRKLLYVLRREISLKVKCEKVNFSNGNFYNNFPDYEWTYM